MRLYHDSRNTEYRDPFGAVPSGSEVRLRIWAPDADTVHLRLWTDGEETVLPMERDGEDFSICYVVPGKPCVVWYCFIAEEDGETEYYGNAWDCFGGEGGTYSELPPSYQITVYDASEVPGWYKDSTVYQIFPDRFSRGSDFEQRKQDAEYPAGRRGQGRRFAEKWDERPYYVKDEDGNVTEWTLYGGTLRGVEEMIPYLKSLGITAVYMNPVFKSASNHRYDTADYETIDPMLGDEEAFRSLCGALKDAGIRLIMDGVFSHTGADSRYFDRYGNYGGGAWGDEDSPYRKWYRFRDEEPGYECWWGVKDLPNVEENDPSYREYICGENGILKKWLRCGASGWRLDVADELPDSFIREVRSAVKSESEDDLLIGEVWEDASNKISYGILRQYFSGHELDSVMSYPFRKATLGFIMNEEPAGKYVRRMLSLKENYPRENYYGCLNLIGGHDRTRVMTVLGEAGDVPEEERRDFTLSEWYYAIAKKRLRMVSALQYATPGVPCIYYGDEAGMQGHTDPYNRGAFPWGHEDTELTYHYRMLGLIYREHPVLKNGCFDAFSVGDDVYCVMRSDADERILTAVNRSYTEHIKVTVDVDETYALELLDSKEIEIKDGKLEFFTDPLSVKMILLRKEAPRKEKLERSAGVICHIGSVPGGCLGTPAEQFADFLAASGIKLWQVLPLNPTGLGNSPYHSPAVFAGNPDLINTDELPSMDGYGEFCLSNSYWLDDYALYTAIKEKNGMAAWQEWPENERDRIDLEGLKTVYSGRMDEIKRQQYCFFTQWQRLLDHAHEKGLEIVGDMPIYVAPDSADLWAHRGDFHVGPDGHLRAHAGVPPDCFTPEGQDWGNPLYDWDSMKKNGYEWWLSRFRICAERFDYVRLDHFRSFSEYFYVPQGISPKFGYWQQGVGSDLFSKVSGVGIIAEDLGILDPGVFNLLKLTGYPGMNVWQFTANEMQEMTDEEMSGRIFCSGTHDNHPILAWYKLNLNPEDARARAEEAIRWLFESKAPWVMITLQDMLMLDDDARLNTPGTCNDKNWKWRCDRSLLTDEVSVKYMKLAGETGRR